MEKRILVLLLVWGTLFAISVNAKPIVIKHPLPTTSGTPPRPHAPSPYIPVWADIESEELTVGFEYAVGTATLSIIDDSDNVVYYTILDTEVNTETLISLAGYSHGDYTLRIEYGGILLTGDFPW